MSRAQKILDMALKQTCNNTETFIVNEDGSLIKENYNDLAGPSDGEINCREPESVFTNNDYLISVNELDLVHDTSNLNETKFSEPNVTEKHFSDIDIMVVDYSDINVEISNSNVMVMQTTSDLDLGVNSDLNVDHSGSNVTENQSPAFRQLSNGTCSQDQEIAGSLCVSLDNQEYAQTDNNPAVSKNCVDPAPSRSVNCVNTVTEKEQNDDYDNKDETIEMCKRNRKKRHQVTPRSWKINEWKTGRKFGNAYCGKKYISGKWMYSIPKDERKMKPRCVCKRKESSLLQCSAITEMEREENFKEFWKLNWDAKKLFVKFLTKRVDTVRARDRKDTEKSRRKNSCQYYLKKNGNCNIRVQNYVSYTLSIGEWTALNWQNENNGSSPDDSDENSGTTVASKESDNSQPISKKLRKSDQVEVLDAFFRALPKVESHYCRVSSSKMYLEPDWVSKRQLYLFYKEDWCVQKNIEPLSQCRFVQIFSDHNLSLFKPKKDECDTCLSYKVGNVATDVYETHLLRKEEARIEKQSDKDDSTCRTFTMDMQAVLQSPKSNASSLYYKRKLSIHNFTVFDLNTSDGFCYLWNETEGGLTANEFSTIISHFLLLQLPLLENVNKIVLYSDGCCYQNRNCTLSNALLHISMTKNIVIEQKYFEKGHSQMEGDAMHSAIERRLKNKKISVPADYITVCEEARKSQKPYSVTYLHHDFFKRFDDHLIYKNITSGRVAGDPYVVDVKAYRYNPDGTIEYKLDFSEQWTKLPARRTKTTATCLVEFPPLYKERLKIAKDKFYDLQELKVILDKDYHQFYDNIPFV